MYRVIKAEGTAVAFSDDGDREVGGRGPYLRVAVAAEAGFEMGQASTQAAHLGAALAIVWAPCSCQVG